MAKKIIVAGTEEMAEALKRIYPDVEEYFVGRATPDVVKGRYVIGSLPPRLAEQAVAVEAPVFNFSPEDRGKTLSPEEIQARYQGSTTTVTFGEMDLQEAEKSRGALYEYLAEVYEQAKRQGADLLVTRHQGLVDFLREYGVVGENVEVKPHIASPDEVRDRIIAGIVPAHLAKEAKAVIAPPPIDAGRGQELSATEMKAVLAEKGIAPPGTQVVVVRSLEDPSFRRLLAETPPIEIPKTALEAKVEAIKAHVQVEVEAERVREAPKSLGEHLQQMRHDGHHGGPTPAYLEMERVLVGVLQEEKEGKAKVSLAQFQALDEALTRYPRESVLEGANAWAAVPPEALTSLVGDLRQGFSPETPERNRDLEIG